jgi:hypothetical protein
MSPEFLVACSIRRQFDIHWLGFHVRCESMCRDALGIEKREGKKKEAGDESQREEKRTEERCVSGRMDGWMDG